MEEGTGSLLSWLGMLQRLNMIVLSSIVVSGLIASAHPSKGIDGAIVILLPAAAPVADDVYSSRPAVGIKAGKTDNGGHYHIPNVKPGRYIIVVRSYIMDLSDHEDDSEVAACETLLHRKKTSAGYRVHCEPVLVEPGDDVEVSWTAH